MSEEGKNLSVFQLNILKSTQNSAKPDLEYLKELRDFQRIINTDLESLNKQLEDKARANTVTVTAALGLAALIGKPENLLKNLTNPTGVQITALTFIIFSAVLIIVIFVQNTAVQRPSESKLVDPEWVFTTLSESSLDRATLLRTQQKVYFDYATESQAAHIKKAKTVKSQFNLVIFVFVSVFFYFAFSFYYQSNP